MMRPIRREAVRSGMLFLVLLALSAPRAAPQAADQTFVREVATVGFTVEDVDRSAVFFTNVLSFEQVSDVELAGEPYERLQGLFGVRMRVVRLRLGAETVELTEYLAPRGRPFAYWQARSNDRSFQHIAIVVRDMQRAYQRLRRYGVTHISSGPQRLPDWNPDAGGIEAFYFRDPDGHPLEIIAFPPGKGDPRWQDDTDRLFLGIDHTAIVVEDTEASLRFYRDLLGLQVSGRSENYGTEQEHLNAVFGAHVRITALRAAGGPGIEFLEYLTPGDGRPMPPDERPNDLIHWETTLSIAAPTDLVRVLRAHGTRFVTARLVELPDGVLPFRRGILVRDPDGHVLRLVEP